MAEDVENMDEFTQLLYLSYLAELTVHGSEELVKTIEDIVDKCSWKLKDVYYSEAAELMIDEPVEITNGFIQKMSMLLIKNNNSLSCKLITYLIAYCLCKMINTSSDIKNIPNYLSEFESIYMKSYEDETIVIKYCEALSKATERLDYSEAIQCLMKLEDICYKSLDVFELGIFFLKGLRSVGEKTDFSEAITYLAKGDRFLEDIEDNGELAEFLLDWTINLDRVKKTNHSVT